MKSIIIKLFTETITNNELIKLHDWLENPKNQEILETYVRDYYDLNISTLKNDVDNAYNKVIKSIDQNSKPTKVIPLYKRKIFKYAAAILIFVSVGYFFLPKEDSVSTDTPIIVNNNIKIGTDKAILTLEDGTEVALEKGKNYTSDNVTSNGEELIYNTKTEAKSEQPTVGNRIAYNYLTIPRGGQYFVKLSDGTKVWLNSESKLKYPSSFLDGEERNVELIYGEAYFDVSPSTNHSGSKFNVLTGLQVVEVLGTEFNVKAYQDEINIYTTLVEGKISINNTINQEILNPNEQSIVNAVTNEILVSSIDVASEVSWVNGEFIFHKKSLKDIMKVLSRWYDIDVMFINKELEDVIFTGTLNNQQDINDILLLIKNTDFINFYEIKNKTILLK